MATIKQKKVAENLLENPGKPVGRAMREAGYSEAMAKNPQDLTESKAWQQLMAEYLPDDKLAQVHEQLLGAHRLDHMVFPLMLTDDEIRELVESTGCKVRKISHGETATHCWFWSPDTGAQYKAVELAYKLKSRLKGDGAPLPAQPPGNTQINVFMGEQTAKEFASWFEGKTKQEIQVRDQT